MKYNGSACQRLAEYLALAHQRQELAANNTYDFGAFMGLRISAMKARKQPKS